MTNLSGLCLLPVSTIDSRAGASTRFWVRVQVRVLVICVSTSWSTRTWLLYKYESKYEYWLVSTSTSTSTGLWSTFYTSSSIAFSVSEKGILRFLSTWDKAPIAHCPRKFPLSICLTTLCNLVQWHFNLRIATYWLSWMKITTCC